jgi:hypothetical protein
MPFMLYMRENMLACVVPIYMLYVREEDRVLLPPLLLLLLLLLLLA